MEQCPNCSTPLKENANSCPKCGQSISPAPTPLVDKVAAAADQTKATIADQLVTTTQQLGDLDQAESQLAQQVTKGLEQLSETVESVGEPSGNARKDKALETLGAIEENAAQLESKITGKADAVQAPQADIPAEGETSADTSTEVQPEEPKTPQADTPAEGETPADSLADDRVKESTPPAAASSLLETVEDKAEELVEAIAQGEDLVEQNAEHLAEDIAEEVEEELRSPAFRSKLFLFGIIALVALAGIFGFQLLSSSGSKSATPETPVIYLTVDPADPQSGTLHLNGKNMKAEALFDIRRLKETGIFFPIATSPDGKHVAYIANDHALYYGSLTQLDGNTQDDPALKIFDKASDIIDFSPDGSVLFFTDEAGGLHTYDGTTVALLDSNTSIAKLQSGKPTFAVLDGNRVVYTKPQGESLGLYTAIADQPDSVKEIGGNGAFSLASPKAKGLSYFITEPRAGATEEEVAAMLPTAIVITSYYYDFATGQSTLISDQVGQILWVDEQSSRSLFMDLIPDPTVEIQFRVALYYFDGTTKQLVTDKDTGTFYVSKHQERMVYSVVEDGITHYYLQSFKKGLDQPQLAYSTDKPDETVIFTFSANRAELQSYHYLGESQSAELYSYKIGGDGVPSAPTLLEAAVDYPLGQQLDGETIYIKNSTDTGEIGDLYVLKGGKPTLIATNVWGPSLEAIDGSAVENEDLLFLTVADREEPTTGTLTHYIKGKSNQVAQDIALNSPGQALPIHYRSSSLIYYLSNWISEKGGDLYRYNGSKSTFVSSGVVSLF